MTLSANIQTLSWLCCILLTTASVSEAQEKRGQPTAKKSSYAINLTFAHDPGPGHYNGVWGKPKHHWNMISPGTREVSGLVLSNGRKDDVSLRLSENDGGWGIEGQMGVYHGYIYHNCRCVDLKLEFHYLAAGTYDIAVFAHGDAPNQNAAVSVTSGDVTLPDKRTLNDKTWEFRSRDFEEGSQYVRFQIDVKAGEPLLILSKRDGSSYAMVNAVQIRRVGKSRS